MDEIKPIRVSAKVRNMYLKYRGKRTDKKTSAALVLDCMNIIHNLRDKNGLNVDYISEGATDSIIITEEALSWVIMLQAEMRMRLKRVVPYDEVMHFVINYYRSK